MGSEPFSTAAATLLTARNGCPADPFVVTRTAVALLQKLGSLGCRLPLPRERPS
eukprot:COSAG04_NODE_690_length_11140_cov_13.093651_13_plen_54_part_00